jgi:hypothetical protein
MQANVANAPDLASKADEPIFQRIWPPAALACGLGLTAAWVSFLGYGLFSLVELAILREFGV